MSLHVVFYTSPKPHRIEIAETFAKGVRTCGDTISFRPLGTGLELEEKSHAAVIIGNKTRYLLDPIRKVGWPVVCLDRAYAILDGGNLARDRAYSRVTVNGSHPNLVRKLCMPDDRRWLFGWKPRVWRRTGTSILFTASAQSYYSRIGVTDVRGHVKHMIAEIRKHTRRPVFFRPKPNMSYLENMLDIEDVDYTPKDARLADLFADCHCLVVEESSTSIEALLAGIPAVVLGPSPTLPISEIHLKNVDNPYLAHGDDKISLLNDLAYFQYNAAEYAEGRAWEFIRKLPEMVSFAHAR